MRQHVEFILKYIKLTIITEKIKIPDYRWLLNGSHEASNFLIPSKTDQYDVLGSHVLRIYKTSQYVLKIVTRYNKSGKNVRVNCQKWQ